LIAFHHLFESTNITVFDLFYGLFIYAKLLYEFMFCIFYTSRREKVWGKNGTPSGSAGVGSAKNG